MRSNERVEGVETLLPAAPGQHFELGQRRRFRAAGTCQRRARDHRRTTGPRLYAGRPIISMRSARAASSRDSAGSRANAASTIAARRLVIQPVVAQGGSRRARDDLKRPRHALRMPIDDAAQHSQRLLGSLRSQQQFERLDRIGRSLQAAFGSLHGQPRSLQIPYSAVVARKIGVLRRWPRGGSLREQRNEDSGGA